MSNYRINTDESYEHLGQATQQAVNSGVDPAEVKAFIPELAPSYEKRPRKPEKQPPLLVGVPGPTDAVINERGRIELRQRAEFFLPQQILLVADWINSESGRGVSASAARRRSSAMPPYCA